MTFKTFAFITCFGLLPYGHATELKPAAWVPLPAIGSSPETGFQYGAYVMRIFPQQDIDVPQNRLELLLQGTTQGQYQAYLWPNIFLNNGTLQAKGKLGGKYWPSAYFGEGNTTPIDGDKYADTAIESSLTINVKTTSSIALGGSVFGEYHKIENIAEQPAANQLIDSIYGAQGGLYTGIGINATFDTRDNIDWPRQGLYANANWDWFTPLLGSDLDFNIFSASAAHYFNIENDVIAVSASASAASQKTPFTHLPKPTGDRTLRGANGNRWIGHRALGLQSEYRKTLSNRWAIVGFTDAFQVAEKTTDLALDDFHYSIGFGVRYSMTPDRFNVRLDVGWVDADAINIAISVGEAF